jgi:hypothetical protein
MNSRTHFGVKARLHVRQSSMSGLLDDSLHTIYTAKNKGPLPPGGAAALVQLHAPSCLDVHARAPARVGF